MGSLVRVIERRVVSGPCETGTAHSACGGVLQALLNLGSSDPSLRSAAYNLLCALTQTFDLKIEGQLLETNGMMSCTNIALLSSRSGLQQGLMNMIRIRPF